MEGSDLCRVSHFELLADLTPFGFVQLQYMFRPAGRPGKNGKSDLHVVDRCSSRLTAVLA